MCQLPPMRAPADSRTTSLCSRFGWLKRPAHAIEMERSILDFEIDARPIPPALGELGHRGLARRLVASARAYVGFVRANVAEYDIAEVCHRSRGRPVIRCPILA